jgi:hypothetical protein
VLVEVLSPEHKERSRCIPNTARLIERRVLCDRATPSCSRCQRFHEQCNYGIRVSWPKPGDSRRAIVSVSSVRQAKLAARINLKARLVQASSWDVEFHRYLTAPKNSQPWRPKLPPLSSIPMSIDSRFWASEDQRSLFHYCRLFLLISFAM